jgi:hypothetical protein
MLESEEKAEAVIVWVQAVEMQFKREVGVAQGPAQSVDMVEG